MVYTGYLILDSTQHQGLPIYSMVMLGFVLPLMVLTLATVVGRSLHKPKRIRS